MAEEEKLSDPVEYLKQTKERCPDVVYIFTTRQVKLLSQTGNESYDPKDVNQEFLSDYNAWASMKQRVYQSRQSLRRDMLTPHNINEPIAAEDFLKQTEVLNEVEERLKKIINLRLKTTEDKHGEVRLPRVVRLCRKFNFSKNETEITLFTLTMQAGIERETRYGGYGIDPISLCSFLDIPLQEVLDFLDQERLHMQQGFFPDIQHGYILSSNLSYDTDVCKALMGVDLKQNGFLKIEQTHLADVIAEEPEHQHLRDQTIDDKSKKPDEWDATGEVRLLSPQQSLETEDPNRASQGGEAEDEKEEKKKEEDIQDLDQLLRSERLKEQERKDVAEPEEEETQEDTDPDKLKPYKKDLEYLDDHFQYVCYVMKVKQYEVRMEMDECAT